MERRSLAIGRRPETEVVRSVFKSSPRQPLRMQRISGGQGDPAESLLAPESRGRGARVLVGRPKRTSTGVLDPLPD
jgi:hypothetical protein